MQQSITLLMYCPNCGTEHSLDASYCPSCGQQLSSGGSTETHGSVQPGKKNFKVLILVVVFIVAAIISAGVVSSAFSEDPEESAQIKINVYSEIDQTVFFNIYVDGKFYYSGYLYPGDTISELHTHKIPKSLSNDFIGIEIYTNGYEPADSCTLFVYPDGYYSVNLYVKVIFY